MRHSVAGLLATARAFLLRLVQYRANIALWTMANLLQVVVYLAVWQAVASERGGTVGGYDAAAFAGYFLTLLVVHELTFTFILQEFAGYVRTGEIAPLMLRPLHPTFTMVASNLAFRAQTVVTLGLIAVVLGFAFGARVDVGPSGVLAALVVVPLGAVTRVLVDSLVGFTAMWLVRIDGIRNLYYVTILLLAGQFAPIGVLPEAMQTVAKVLPFYWTLGYPAELASGNAPANDVWIGLLVLSGWCTLLGLLFRPVWRAGTRALETVGS